VYAARGQEPEAATLRKPANNGQRKIFLEPVRFLRKLAWLVPPPGRHMLRYGGILAPAAKRRPRVVPRPPPQIQLVFPIENMRPKRQSFRPGWAALLARTFGVDAERCPRCGGRMRPIGAITDPTEARRALEHMRPPSARDPPQRALAL
jgi:hypothetical protein